MLVTIFNSFDHDKEFKEVRNRRPPPMVVRASSEEVNHGVWLYSEKEEVSHEVLFLDFCDGFGIGSG